VRFSWVLKRIGLSLLRIFVTVFVVLLISFILVRLSPNSPVSAVLSSVQLAGAAGAKAEIAYTYSLYPSGPLYMQYLEYVWAVLHGNLGHSIISQLPVLDIVSEALPWTLLIVVTSTLISFAIGTVLGMLMAYRRGEKKDVGAITLFSITSSFPIYFVALVLLIVLTFTIPIFPHSGAYDVQLTPGFDLPFIASVAAHAFLPILALVIVNLGGWALTMRANTISVLGEDFVIAAETRGIPSFTIATRYVGRNAILPQFTSLVLALGFSFVGSVFVENIFTYPGMGYTLITAVNLNDYSVIMGIFIAYILAVVIGLSIADVLYSLLDPRAR
jgi:peptide/nickel transport system permease protein